MQIAVGVAVVALLSVIPELVGYRLSSYTLLLTDVLIFMSLGLLVRVAGQVSLCQVSFAAIGAVAFSKLAVGAHVPWVLALVLGALAAVPIGALLAIPAIRLSGLYLALATLGFGLLLEEMFYSSSLMFGIGGGAVLMPRPHLTWLNLSSDEGFYYVVLLVTVLTAICMTTLTRTRLGRLLRGVADSPIAMGSAGNNVTVPLVLVFCISAAVAALAGALQGMVYTQASGVNFDPIHSLLFLAVVLITVGSEPWYALVAAAALALLPIYVTSSSVTSYLQLTFGVIAIAVALGGQPHERLSAITVVRRWLDRFGRPWKAGLLARSPEEEDGRPVTSLRTIDSTDSGQGHLTLEARHIAVRFGGIAAIMDMSLEVSPGRIVGLIGPNGAGKTTMLNACSGLVNLSGGSVSLGYSDLTGMSVSERARRGIGRTFQQMELCDSLTVWDNVALGREAAMAGANLFRQIFPKAGDRRAVEDRVTWAMTQCGLGHVANTQVGAVSSSERRFVELARCLAGGFQFLLLDEPSSGLDRAATERLGSLVRSVAKDHNVGILLVEHDMTLVMSVCDDIYVMESGTLLCHGDPVTVQASETVRDAYLGVEVTNEVAQVEQR